MPEKQPTPPPDRPTLPEQREAPASLSPEAARVFANALDLAEQALSHDDVATADQALDLAELVLRGGDRLLAAAKVTAKVTEPAPLAVALP